MSILSHLAPPIAHRPRLVSPAQPAEHHVGGRVFAVQRLGAVSVGAFLLAFGLLGLSSGVPFLSTQGQRFLGLSANGLLAAISVVVALVLLAAALHGPQSASTAMMALGALFLTSALVNLVAMDTAVNLLAFEMADVVFSVVVGLLLLVLGAYGRVSGHLPDDSPYAHPHPRLAEPPEGPASAVEMAADAAIRAAEIAVVEHRATEEQRHRVQEMATARTRADRRRIWMDHDRPGPAYQAGA